MTNRIGQNNHDGDAKELILAYFEALHSEPEQQECDPKRISRFFTDDCRVYPNGNEALIGINAFEAYLRGSWWQNNGGRTKTMELRDFQQYSDCAVAHGCYFVRRGDTVDRRGSAITIARKSSSGVWRIDSHIFNREDYSHTAPPNQ